MANTPAPTLLERLLDAIVDQLSPEAAEAVTNLYAPDEVRARLDVLAGKVMGDGLDPVEQDEYEGLMRIVTAVSMIQDRIDARSGLQPPPVVDSPTHVESVDLGAAVVPVPAPASPDARFEGLEALLDDLDENLRPQRRD